jgi:hypothetical protein
VTDWTDAIWADGSKVVEWVETHLDLSSDNDGTFFRALGRWRSGGAASVYALDRFLTPYDRHISELPPDVWLDRLPRDPRTRRPTPRQIVPLEPRFCEACGDEIPIGKSGPSRYRQARFCCRRCAHTGTDVNREFVARGYREQAA